MAYKKFSGGDYPPSWDFGHNKVFEGILKGKREDAGPNKTKAFTFEAKKDNKDYTIWGSAVLDSLAELRIGTLVKITSLGKKKNPKTNREFNAYEMEIDEDNLPEKDSVELAEEMFRDN